MQAIYFDKIEKQLRTFEARFFEKFAKHVLGHNQGMAYFLILAQNCPSAPTHLYPKMVFYE